MNRRHVRHGCLIALATACAWLGGERQLRAQSEADSWPLPYPNLRAVAEMTAASAADDVAFTLQGLQTPTPAPTPAPAPNHFAGRACDGCPWRRPGTALLQATYINVVYGLANLIRGQVTARITPSTWWANMEQGWVWDLDEFVVNQFGHPYQGNNYFNAGRANGLSFWESAAVTAFGSGTWEYFGETNHASLNDFINTTMGGIALGEMFHRAAWLVRNPQNPSKKREIIALAIDPVTGVNRFLSGDASHASQKPPDLVPSSLGALFSAGVLWQEDDTPDAETAVRAFAEMDLRYGEPTEGRSRTPYDAFLVRFRLGGGSAISEAKVRGRLLGQPVKKNAEFIVSQSYDFTKNGVYAFGAQGIEGNLSASYALSSRTAVRVVGYGGLTVLGAVDSLPLEGTVTPEPEEPSEDAGQGVSEGPREYDYGPGTTFGGGATFSINGRSFAVATYEGRHLFVVDGVRANHLLQRLRVDVLVPVHGAFGLGLTAEYFSRRTYYKDVNQTKRDFDYPQFGVYLTWRTS